jgi:hypothetical protein
MYVLDPHLNTKLSNSLRNMGGPAAGDICVLLGSLDVVIQMIHKGYNTIPAAGDVCIVLGSSAAVLEPLRALAGAVTGSGRGGSNRGSKFADGAERAAPRAPFAM